MLPYIKSLSPWQGFFCCLLFWVIKAPALIFLQGNIAQVFRKFQHIAFNFHDHIIFSKRLSASFMNEPKKKRP